MVYLGWSSAPLRVKLYQLTVKKNLSKMPKGTVGCWEDSVFPAAGGLFSVDPNGKLCYDKATLVYSKLKKEWLFHKVKYP